LYNLDTVNVMASYADVMVIRHCHKCRGRHWWASHSGLAWCLHHQRRDWHGQFVDGEL